MDGVRLPLKTFLKLWGDKNSGRNTRSLKRTIMNTGSCGEFSISDAYYFFISSSFSLLPLMKDDGRRKAWLFAEPRWSWSTFGPPFLQPSSFNVTSLTDEVHTHTHWINISVNLTVGEHWCEDIFLSTFDLIAVFELINYYFSIFLPRVIVSEEGYRSEPSGS